MTPEERFWSKVDKSGDCWNWTASKDQKGYGYFGIYGKVRRAHRVAWEMEHGPIDPKFEIDHRCHNRACVRPSHLRRASRKQNMENQSGPHKNSSSGVRGVHWRPETNKWVAQVNHNQKRHHVGQFDDLAEAEAAVIAKRNELFTHNDLDRPTIERSAS